MSPLVKKKKQIKKVHKEVVSSIKNLPKDVQVQKLREVFEDEINSEIEKLPKRMKNKMRKLADMYINGKVLKPNEDVDNKKLMLENS